MTAADTNVRAGWRRAAASARGVGRFRLARLLLESFQKLDRKAVPLLLLAASLTSACIIPVGPEWQDPNGAPNAPPQIFDPFPSWGAQIGGDVQHPGEFQMFVTDVNADPLEIKWVVDGDALFSGPSTIPSDGTPRRYLVQRSIGCDDDIDATLATHSVWGMVADRAFPATPPGGDQFAVPAPGYAVAVTWTLILTCQSGAQ
jgi:hypothetical protein